MKIAFDENIPSAMVRMFRILAEEKQLKKLTSDLEIESAADYAPKVGDGDYKRKNDSPWIVRFAKVGGKVIISGDTKMKSRFHERRALVEAGFVTIFFESKWSNWRFFKKCALLLHWWPEIARAAKSAPPGTFWHIPGHWNDGKLRQVSNEDLKLIKKEAQLKARDVVRSKRRRIRTGGEDQGELPLEVPEVGPRPQEPRTS